MRYRIVRYNKLTNWHRPEPSPFRGDAIHPESDGNFFRLRDHLLEVFQQNQLLNALKSNSFTLLIPVGILISGNGQTLGEIGSLNFRLEFTCHTAGWDG
ncbi:MAG: hypothetical protein ACEPOZ_19765 [Marinifilaceae bacterium]